MLELAAQVHPKLVELDKSRAGKLTIRVLCHDELQLVAFDKSISDGNEVREVQPFHALPMLNAVVVLNVTAGKEVKPVHPYHAL